MMSAPIDGSEGIAIEIEPDRFFDPWKTPRSPAANALVEKIIGNVLAYEEYYRIRKRQRRAKDFESLRSTVSAVMCDVVHGVLMEDTRGVAIPRSNRVLGGADRYSAPALNRQLPYLLDVLSSDALEWLIQVPGHINPFRHNQRTLIRPTQRLIDNMRDYHLELGSIGRCKSEEVIILKAGKDDYWDKGVYLLYEDCRLTNLYRTEVQTINSWLAGASIGFDEEALERHRLIDTGNVMVRRYFSRGSFGSGGRLFGGFWQGLSKNERLNGITINDGDVVGLDFGQISPRILYGLAGAQPPERDIYDIPDLTVLNGRSYRAGVKTVMSALTFKEGLPSRKPKGTKDFLPPDLSISEIIDLIKQAHPAIACLLDTEVGHRVQFVESRVMVKVLLALKDLGIVALPIHDGLLVLRSSVTKAKTMMEEVFLNEVGVNCPVSVESLDDYNDCDIDITMQVLSDQFSI